jgi:hypothetical protein
MTTIKEQLLAAIETVPESILEKTLKYLQTQQNANSIKTTSLSSEDSEPILRDSKAKDLLEFAGTWQGEDFEDCLQLVYDTRSQAKF